MLSLSNWWLCAIFLFFFFNDTATTEIYTLSLHDALPICTDDLAQVFVARGGNDARPFQARAHRRIGQARLQGLVQAGHHRSEEHTSELQSLAYLVCRLLLEKKK